MLDEDGTEREPEDGGFDPEAFERRRAQLAEAPAVAVKLEPPLPSIVKDWLAEQDAPLMAAFIAAEKALGTKPKATSGPLGLGGKLRKAKWEHAWSAARLELTKGQSAVFSAVPADVHGAGPDAMFHLRQRADRRASLVRKDEAHLAQKLADLNAAQAALDEVEAPKRAGRELALTNVRAGFVKLQSELRKESDLHEAKLEQIAAMPSRNKADAARCILADQGETERHETALETISQRAAALHTQKTYLESRLKLNYAGE